MKSLTFLTLFFILFTCSFCFTTLPSYIKLCSRSDPKLIECAIKNGKEALPFIIKGDPAYHIPSFSPFKLDKVNLEASENVKLQATNVSLVGLELSELRDINWVFDDKEITVKVFTPLLRILGTYNMDGHILVLTLKGSGPMNNSHYDNDIMMKIKYDTYKKNDKDYFKIIKFEVKIDIKTTVFNFDNLLNNPTISKQINQVLTENSKMLIKELFMSVKEIIKDVVLAVLNPIIERVPVDNIVLP